MSEENQSVLSDDITRRQWLLILSRLAAVTGFSGVVPELAAALSGEGQRAALPPGLYYPSQDHLSHAMGEIGSMHAIPPGSETEYVRPSPGPFRPQFFSEDEFKTVTRIVEIMLGKVDSGALSQSVQWLDLYVYSAAGVRQAARNLDPLHRALASSYYGESAMRELEMADPQNVTRAGMAALQQLSNEQYGREFLALDEAQQTNLVSIINTAKEDTPLHKFFELMRTEAARGYYTSAEGLKELDYKGNWYYASCPGCEQKA